MFTWKYEDLKYGWSETWYADYGITRKKSGVERSRIFEKAVYVTPLQTHFRLSYWSTSDKPLRKQTFRQYRPQFYPPVFLPSETLIIDIQIAKLSRNICGTANNFRSFSFNLIERRFSAFVTWWFTISRQSALFVFRNSYQLTSSVARDSLIIVTGFHDFLQYKTARNFSILKT